MDKEYFFISGLPRSGSTLLSAILKQNPNFHADIESPLCNLTLSTIKKLTLSENSINIDKNKREKILKSIFDSYYYDTNKPTVFDSARAWTANTFLLKKLFPYTKILVCVREIKWILDSFERIASKNCYYTNTFVHEEALSNVESRCKSSMTSNEGGQIINPLLWLQEGVAANPEMIFFVEYDHLCKKPKETLQKIYQFINKPYFNHDFNNVKYKNELFDTMANCKDLHTVKNKVEWVERKFIIPEYVLKKYENMEFWRESTLKYG